MAGVEVATYRGRAKVVAADRVLAPGGLAGVDRGAFGELAGLDGGARDAEGEAEDGEDGCDLHDGE